jgi:type IV pilus assembly protein PilA
MYCTTCGQQNPDNNKFCSNCGTAFGAQVGGNMPPPPIPNMPPPPGAAVYTPQEPNAPNDGKAVASLILGILSMTLFSFLAGIPAIILGHMSRSNIRRSLGKLKGEGLALAGLIMGYISLLITIPVILIIAAIAIPNLLRARMAANEASAIGSLRIIATSNVEYAQKYGGFAPSLAAMGGSHCEHRTTTKEEACLLPAQVASGVKSGYRLTYTPEDTDGDGIADKYFVLAEPVSKGASGRSTYCVDESAVIHKEADGSRCTLESPVLEGDRSY